MKSFSHTSQTRPSIDPKENWDDRRKKEQTLKLARENKIAEMRYIETEFHVDTASDMVQTLWTAVNNLTNTVPQKMPGLSEQDRIVLRELLVSEIQFAKSELEKYLESLVSLSERIEGAGTE